LNKVIEQKQKNEAEAEKLLASIDTYLLKELGVNLPEPPENTLKNRMFTTNINAVTGSRLDPFFHQKRFDVLKNPISKYPTKRIKEINEEIKTGLPVRKDYRIEDGAYPYYGANGIIGFMDEFTHDGLYLVIGQDGYIGKHYVVEGKFWGSNHNWVLKLKDGYNYEFVKASLDALKYNYLITGGVIPKLTKEALESIRIPVPPLDKQKEIANHVTDIRNKAQQLKDKTKELLKKASEEIEEILLN
jgi:restriction endonuclease S subunit